jgi:TonB-dependent SusC/RagA subfamily outer membrane receptor
LPVGQIGQKLQGRIAGVQINQTSGTPGSGMSVRIRGAASINAGNSPLYVVDGFPITGNINQINPDEIETITVLKDASGAALYGSRASNGVVLITTKSGKEGKTQIQFNAVHGFQQLPTRGRPDRQLMNASEYAQYRKEVYEDAGQPVPEQYQDPSHTGRNQLVHAGRE